MNASMPMHGEKGRSAAALLLGCLALVLVTVRILLVRENILPMHDTFQRFCMQQVSLWNEPALCHGIPQWNPSLCHGMANYWHLLAGLSMLGAILPLAAPVLHGLNGLVLGHATLLVDELALLVGCVLLARRWYASTATLAFVTCAVALTAVSFAQCHYNLRLICLVPLVLYCGDRAVRDGSVRHFAAMAALGVGMAVLNLAYVAPLLAFTLMVFAAGLSACAGRATARVCGTWIRSLSWRHALVLVGGCLLLALAWCYLRDCVGGAHVFRRGDAGSAEVSLATFMSYGGCVSIAKYLELIWRYSNHHDVSLYGGMLLVPCVVVAVLRVRLPLAHACGITALVLVLFSSGTCVSAGFYHLFPFGKMYRHIGLSAPLAKLFIVLYAGFGFDVLWQSLRTPAAAPVPLRRRPQFIAAAVLAVLFMLVLAQRLDLIQWYAYSSDTYAVRPPWNYLYLTPETKAVVDARVIQILGAFTALMSVSCIARRLAPIIASMVLILHCVDVATYKVEMEATRTPRASPALRALFDVRSHAFAQNRASNAWIMPAVGIVHGELKDHSDLFHMVFSLDAVDATWSPFHVDLCEEPFFQFLCAWNTNAAIGSSYKAMTQPVSAAFGKASGRDMPKLQVFARAHAVPSDAAAATILCRTNFAGDALLVTDIGGTDPVPIPPDAYGRVSNATVAVCAFSRDRLEVDVDNPAAATGMLYYADTWHPFWHATVNGTAVPVLRANIAYKAVSVPPGLSHVVFTFGTAWSTFLTYGVVGIAALALCTVIWLGAADIILPAVLARRTLGRYAMVASGIALCAAVAASGSMRAGLLRASLTASMDRDIARYSALRAADPSDTAVLVARGDTYCRRGDVRPAMADYTAAKTLDPGCAAAHVGLCDTHMLCGNYWEASVAFLAAFRCTTAAAPMSADAATERDARIAALAAQAARGSKDPQVYHMLSLLRLRAGARHAAAQDHSRMLDLLPPPPGAHGYYERGLARMEYGLHAQARKDFAEVVQLIPGSAKYRAQLDAAHAALTGAVLRSHAAEDAQ